MDPERVESVRSFLKAGREPMLASLKRNCNVDCTGVATLKNAPVNSDQCEGGFGGTGYHLDRDNKSWYSAFGITMAERSHAYQDADEIMEKELKKQKKQDKAGGKKVPYGKTEVAEKDVVKWKMVSYFAMPEEARHKLLDAAEKTFGAHRKKATGQRPEGCSTSWQA